MTFLLSYTCLLYTSHTLENGLRIGISGIVTDYVNVWEQPETLAGLRITDAFTAASHAYERLRPQCDICICIYHGGFERDLQDGRILSYTGENIGWKLCEELGYDLVLTGHQHAAIEGTDINKTYAVQCPGGAERYVFLEVEEEDKKVDIGSRILPVEKEHEREPYDTLLPFECMVEQWLNQPVGWMANDILPEEKLKAALGGSRMAALFNQVQLAVTGAELSCTSLGNTPVGLYSPVTMKGIYKMCIRDRHKRRFFGEDPVPSGWYAQGHRGHNRRGRNLGRGCFRRDDICGRYGGE